MHKNKILLFFICALILGCQRQETAVPIEIRNLIVEGKTTKQEILEIFGKPTSITSLPRFQLVSKDLNIPDELKSRLISIENNVPSRLKGGEIWNYTQINIQKGRVFNTLSSDYLTVMFDLDGVVSEFHFKSARARY